MYFNLINIRNLTHLDNNCILLGESRTFRRAFESIMECQCGVLVVESEQWSYQNVSGGGNYGLCVCNEKELSLSFSFCRYWQSFPLSNMSSLVLCYH